MSQDALDRQEVEMYTDGACRGNPGPGGWGVLLRYGGHEKTLSGADAATTNNRMELMAAIRGLEALSRHCNVRLHTDSQYVRNGILQWLDRWKKRAWRTANGAPVKNIDLWRRLDEVTQAHRVEWIWVKGHSGVAGNEEADRLAGEAIDAAQEAGEF